MRRRGRARFRWCLSIDAKFAFNKCGDRRDDITLARIRPPFDLNRLDHCWSALYIDVEAAALCVRVRCACVWQYACCALLCNRARVSAIANFLSWRATNMPKLYAKWVHNQQPRGSSFNCSNSNSSSVMYCILLLHIAGTRHTVTKYDARGDIAFSGPQQLNWIRSYLDVMLIIHLLLLFY